MAPRRQLSVIPAREFTGFSKLPLELRNMIWEEAAKVPRNVDVWSPTFGSMTLRADGSGEQVVVKPYRFISKQSPPSILHTNQESRVIALKFIHLDFGNDFDGDGLGFALIFEPTIMCYKDDRICPMGPYTETAMMDLFICNRPLSYALNVFHKATSPSPIESFSYAVEFPQEILLYYHTKDVKGSFEFVDIPEAGFPKLHWRVLVDGKARILEHHKQVVASYIARCQAEYEDKGEKAPERIELPERLICPEVKLVKVVVNGARKR
ncbi:hypothetical protein BDZ45DRAFT_742853 [Acephala macrosclerotiorum]|nr:hypothetical protein BDZ45DRAFT_742853 [Acephala macrosclerotiorum]